MIIKFIVAEPLQSPVWYSTQSTLPLLPVFDLYENVHMIVAQLLL